MGETKLLTAKELSEKAGISPADLRKLFRKEFDRSGKTQVEGKKAEYRFDLNDETTPCRCYSVIGQITICRKQRQQALS